jgi:hypothetical protein
VSEIHPVYPVRHPTGLYPPRRGPLPPYVDTLSVRFLKLATESKGLTSRIPDVTAVFCYPSCNLGIRRLFVFGRSVVPGPARLGCSQARASCCCCPPSFTLTTFETPGSCIVTP